MRRALSDPAVRDHRLVIGHALSGVELAERVSRLERVVVLDRLCPGDVGGTRDVSGALCALIRVLRGRGDLAVELRGRAHVDECAALGTKRLLDVASEAANRGVGFGRLVRGGRERWGILGDFAPLIDPLATPAVEQTDVSVAIDPEGPECERREPVPEVAVEDERGLGGRPDPREELLELLPGEDVTADGVVDVALPVDQGRAGNVPQLVRGRRVVVDFEHPHLRVGEVTGQPLGGDQDLWMGVFGHEELLLLMLAVPERRLAARLRDVGRGRCTVAFPDVTRPTPDSLPCQTGCVPSRASGGASAAVSRPCVAPMVWNPKRRSQVSAVLVRSQQDLAAHTPR